MLCLYGRQHGFCALARTSRKTVFYSPEMSLSEPLLDDDFEAGSPPQIEPASPAWPPREGSGSRSAYLAPKPQTKRNFRLSTMSKFFIGCVITEALFIVIEHLILSPPRSENEAEVWFSCVMGINLCFFTYL